jgi:methionine-S-sulfoxide reductase
MRGEGGHGAFVCSVGGLLDLTLRCQPQRAIVERTPKTTARGGFDEAFASADAPLRACYGSRMTRSLARAFSHRLFVLVVFTVAFAAGVARAASPSPVPPARETAILAGGCFWGMEEILRAIPGVLETDAGYTGGNTSNPTYEDVHTGATGHAESVRVVFDPSKLSYEDLLEKWFFRMHDPTTKNRQGNDVGSQYRSAIFYTSEAQRVTAERVIARVNASGKWKSPIVTTVEAAGPFTLAEEEHQDYLQKHPGGYTCHYLRE